MTPASEFESFYQASYGRIVALLLGVLGDRQEAEDAAQEAFARALARWPRLSSYDVPEAWVRQVALRLAVDSGRRLRRSIRLSARLTGARQAPAHESGDRVAFSDLGSALMRLPLREHEVLVLHYFADMTAERIAAERGGPVQQAPVPDVGVIRRRLRRRRARQAAAGTMACALAAAVAITLVHGSTAPAPSMVGPGPTAHQPCHAGQLRVDPHAVLVRTNAVSMEPLPDTYLLRIRNTGRAACTLTGWPRFSIAAPRSMRAVHISYGTLITRPARNGPISRVIKPARVELRPRAQAAAMVTVTYPLDEVGCGTAVWSVTPPQSDGPCLYGRCRRAGRSAS